ncbi:hypothetical protein RQP46_010940 [Phenoliferia psychrophenolica]
MASRVSKHPASSGSNASPSGIAELNAAPTSFSVELSEVNTRETPHRFVFLPSFGDGDTSRFPDEDDDIKQLGPDHSKHNLWRRTAAEWLAKDLDLYDDSEKYWILEDLPAGYGLFEQITHPKLDVPKRGGPGLLRRDRFIFGHAGRKLRSALSLGKHLSWIISGSTEVCECDGCKSTSKAARVPRVPKEGGAADKKRKANKGKERASLWDGNSDDEGDDDSDLGGGEDFDDESERSASSPRKKAKFGGGAQGQGSVAGPSSSTATGQTKYKVARAPAIPVFPLPARHEFTNMVPVREDPSDVKPTSRSSDLEYPSLSRVGELVWAELDLPEGGRTQLTHWPAIVRERIVMDAGGGDVSADYSLQLVAVNGLVQVEGLGVVPFLGYEEPTPAELVDEDDYVMMPETLKTKWTLDSLQQAHPATVNVVFILAVHIAKWIATMQIRSVPSIELGLHLIPTATPTSRASPLQNLTPSSPTARFLSHSFIGYGPETFWLSDLVRLIPTVDLPLPIKSSLLLPSKSSLPTSLILRISKFVRGGSNAPLLARGRLFEMEECSDATLAADLKKKAASPNESSSKDDLPPPFPGHRWRTVASTVDVLASEIAGRYYPLSIEMRDRMESVNEVAEQARMAGTAGEGGVAARSLLLGGVVVREWTPRITATNGVVGGRKQMLAVAEEMAMVGPPLPSLFEQLSHVDTSNTPLQKDLTAWAQVLASNPPKAKVKGRGESRPARAAKGKGRARLADLLDDDSEMEMD